MHADPIKGAADVPLNDVLQRTGGSGQLNHQAGARAAQDELLHHLQGDDVLAEFGLLDGAQRLHYLGLADIRHRPSSLEQADPERARGVAASVPYIVPRNAV